MKIFILFASSILQLSLVTSQNEPYDKYYYIISFPELSQQYNFDSGWLPITDSDPNNKQLCKLVNKAPIFVLSDTSFAGSKWLDEMKELRQQKKEVENIYYSISQYSPNNQERESIICQIGGSIVYISKNSNFNDGLILLTDNGPEILAVFIAPLKMHRTYKNEHHHSYSNLVDRKFREIVDAKKEKYTLNEVEKSLFSRSWYEKAQLCISSILRVSIDDLHYENKTLNISQEEIDPFHKDMLILFNIPITVLHCELKGKNKEHKYLTHSYIFPHPTQMDKIFILYKELFDIQLHDTHSVEAYTITDSRYLH